jgi:outer membrane biosynthesis protein TonB
MDARVKLVNTATGTNAEVRTGKVGTFQFTGLPDGQYTVEVSQPGFATLKATVAMANAGVKRDLKLELGSVRESLHIRLSADETGGRPAASTSPAVRPPKAPRIGARPCSAAPAGGGNIDPPLKLKDVKPEYPASLKAEKVVGDVVVEGVVGKDGIVHDMRVVEARHPDLARAMTDAIAGWLFEPTLLNCEPVAVKMTVKARFDK